MKPRVLPDVLTVSKMTEWVLDHTDIVYCCTVDNKTIVKSFKGEFISNLTLASLEQKLENTLFENS